MVTFLRRTAPTVQFADVPPPQAVMLYLDDFCGGRCRCLVRSGDRVRQGQLIGVPDGNGAAVHASVSGVVRAVGGGAVVIENDFRNEPAAGTEPLSTLEEAAPEVLRQRLASSGILTAEDKPLWLPPDRPCHLLALDLLPRDAADTEPLAWETPDRVFGGLRALMQILQPRRTLVLWDRRRPDMGQLIQRYGVPAETLAVDGRRPVPLSQWTGRPLEPGVALADLGCLMLDAQGSVAVWEALYWGQPFLRRQVLVTGPQRGQAVSLTAPLGTAVSHLLAAAQRSAPTVLLGSERTGRMLRELQTPIGKADGRIACLAGR